MHDLITADLAEHWAGWELRRKMELERSQLGMRQRPTWKTMTRRMTGQRSLDSYHAIPKPHLPSAISDTNKVTIKNKPNTQCLCLNVWLTNLHLVFLCMHMSDVTNLGFEKWKKKKFNYARLKCPWQPVNHFSKILQNIFRDINYCLLSEYYCNKKIH